MMDDWRQQAACRDADPEIFFTRGPNLEFLPEAKQLCRECPVRTECLAEALRVKDVHGFRGGHSGEERRQMLPKTWQRVPVDEVLAFADRGWSLARIASAVGSHVDSVRRIVKAHRGQESAA